MTRPFSLYRSVIKRTLDVLVAATFLLVFSPVILVLALLIRRQMGTPVLFRQPRGGRGGRQFILIKFRTMRDAHDAAGNPLPDDQRLTRFGNTLRRLSLDELPQLWNVLRGDMSLIGPRPLLVEYLPRYSAEQARRHEVLPGITGWAQVNGRNAISWDDKFGLDVWYVDHVSWQVDLQILCRTALRLVQPSDINAAGHATMPKFMGEQDRSDGSPQEPQGS